MGNRVPAPTKSAADMSALSPTSKEMELWREVSSLLENNGRGESSVCIVCFGTTGVYSGILVIFSLLCRFCVKLALCMILLRFTLLTLY